MKVIDMKHMELVFAGESWTHNILPCAKQAIPLLERNEKIVSWIKPVGSGVSQHIPAIMYKDKFFSLSLRMQKAIYRHIRLKKGFKNEEIMDGIVKLRIPDVLLKEKIRTQSRFDAMRKGMKNLHPHSNKFHHSSYKKKTDADDKNSHHSEMEHQHMMNFNTHQKKERHKNTCTVSARMRQVVHEMVNSTEEQNHNLLQQITIFAFKSHQNEIISSFLQDLRNENSVLYQNKEALLQVVADAYDQSRLLFANV